MSLQLVLLALLMGAVTYPARAVPLLAPAFERLPPRALEYLRLVGPAVLGAIAAKEVLLAPAASGAANGAATLHVGWEALAVLACVGIVAWRHNLFLGLVVAVVLIAGARAAGIA